jgi:hypothetical protein
MIIMRAKSREPGLRHNFVLPDAAAENRGRLPCKRAATGGWPPRPGTEWSVLTGLIVGWRRRYSGQARLS